LTPPKKDAPRGFSGPTALPSTEADAQRWQEANRAWWESHPMSYNWKSPLSPKEFSRGFYLEIDRRFFSKSAEFLPWKTIPFDGLIPFGSLHDKEVLEIGVGNGSHAQLLCQYARSFTGIDLTDYAVKSTANRMRLFELKASILRMDAERMDFPDNRFDFIWSWGVIHHSSNTRQVLEEIRRVLKPGGQAALMVYHRGFWNYYLMGVFRGLAEGVLFRTGFFHKTTQRWTDGAIARFYTFSEWTALVSDLFRVKRIGVFGAKADLVPLPAGPLKEWVLRLFPNRVARFLTHHCRMGGFLVSTIEKPG